MLSTPVSVPGAQVLSALLTLLSLPALLTADTRLYDLDIERLDAASLLLESFAGVEQLDGLSVFELICLSTDT
ncbi:hypothetical protein HNQ59_003943 [Chitinivorax tropicus]|uniref:Uncharacterized protein n=1 Tax=Chitinivorax tropicus TaxID=714531 RepID=A0A840MPQ4_9PROT|nr:hypothetical protein [Chitinivorax tropicus]MBB5020618.1 hypothetical protein [Chitinivorax tropicus]